MTRHRALGLLVVLAAWGLSACAGARSHQRPDSALLAPEDPDAFEKPRGLIGPPDEKEWAPYPESEGSALGEAIVKAAASLVGRRTMKPLNRHTPDDCMGLVRYVYERVGIDLVSVEDGRGNATNMLYRGAKDLSLVRMNRGRRGDLVFFRETYDVNRDGRRNDGMTHVGIVESVDANGTVHFIHRSGQGVVFGAANPERPSIRFSAEGDLLNDTLRRASKKSRAYFAGELLTGFVSPDALGPLAPKRSAPSRVPRS